MLRLLLLITLLAAPAPQAAVRWHDTSLESVSVILDHEQPAELRELLERGLELRFRTNIKLCRKRGFWFDPCGKTGLEIKQIKRDQLSDNYRISEDRFYDQEEPLTRSVERLDDALQQARHVSAYPLKIILGRQDLAQARRSKRSYLYVRLEVEVVRSRSMVEWGTYLLSLGLLDAKSYDSGWHKFYLSDL